MKLIVLHVTCSYILVYKGIGALCLKAAKSWVAYLEYCFSSSEKLLRSDSFDTYVDYSGEIRIDRYVARSLGFKQMARPF